MSDNGNNRVFGDLGTGVEVLTNTASHTIQGAGQLGINQLKLINPGTVLANQSSELVVDLTGGRDNLNGTNTGFMTAAAGGKLRIRDSGIANAGGTVQALNGSTVFLDNARINGGLLSADSTSTIQLQNSSVLSGLTTSGVVNLANAQTSYLEGTITNNGEIRVNSTGSITDLILNGSVTLAGPGTLTLGPNANGRVYGVTFSGTEVLTNTASHTIQGAGQLVLNRGGLDNQGLIVANQAGGLTIDLSDGAGVARTNTGTLRAQGGTLTLLNTALDNAGGTVQALNGSTVILDNARINGGLLSADSTSTIHLRNSSVFSGLTTSGVVNLANAQASYLEGTITNNGEIRVNSTSSITDLFLNGSVTLAGPGTLTLGPNANGRVYGVTFSGTEVLTNTASHTIQGAGQLVLNRGGLDNQGLIVANQAGGLTIDLSDGAGVARTNTGTLRAQGGTLTLLNTALDNTGGLIEGVGSTVAITSSTVTGGQLSTSGGAIIELNASTLKNLTNNGTVRLANALTGYLEGTITNNGDIQVNSTGSLTYLRLIDAVALAGSGTLTLGPNANSLMLTNTGGVQDLTNSASHTIQGSGQIGAGTLLRLTNEGTVTANVNGATLLFNGGNSTTTSTGVLRAQNGGVLSFSQGTHTVQAGGLVEALADSRVVFQAGATVTNLASNALTGGIWKANSVGGLSGKISFQSTGSTIQSNKADIYLIGANSVIEGNNTSGTPQSLDSTLQTNYDALRLQQGHVFIATAASGNFENRAPSLGLRGLIELTDSTFQSNNLLNNGSVSSFGTSTLTTGVGNRVTGNGSITANSGTLTITRGVNMGAASSMTSNAGAAIDLSGAALRPARSARSTTTAR